MSIELGNRIFYKKRYAFLCMTNCFVLLILSIMLMFLSSCKEEEPVYPNPSIRFVDEQGYAYEDTTILLNDSIKIGIWSSTASDVALTHFNITLDEDSVITVIDKGIFTEMFEYSEVITKGIAEKETWSFYVRDREGRKSNVISITFFKDSASIFGNVNHIPSIVFGAQNNASIGSFYSLSTEQIYAQSDAFNNQSLINLLCFYDLIEAEDNTISSPGANIDASVYTGTTGLPNWTTINTTRFEYKDLLTVADFDACSNDSLILSNTFPFAVGKRKAKNLSAGDIYSFVTDAGQKGLFKVVNVVGQESGSVEIAIKMKN
jgi:hypothetical protein